MFFELSSVGLYDVNFGMQCWIAGDPKRDGTFVV